MKLAYLAGPEGSSLDAWEAFADAAGRLIDAGFLVTSGLDVGVALVDDPLSDILDTIANAVTAADLVVKLPGWEDSPGARVEVNLAEGLGIPVSDLDGALALSQAQDWERAPAI